jgi:hypothetical protein
VLNASTHLENRVAGQSIFGDILRFKHKMGLLFMMAAAGIPPPQYKSQSLKKFKEDAAT